MASFFSTKSVKNATDAHDTGSTSADQIKTLSSLKMLKSDGAEMDEGKVKLITNMAAKRQDTVVTTDEAGGLKFLTMDEYHTLIGPGSVSSSSQEKGKTAHVRLSSRSESIKDLEDFNTLILKDSFRVSPEQIKEHLQRFINTIPKNGEGYYSGEVQIFYYKQLEKNTEKLVGAGTAVLDAILFCSTTEEGKGIFMFNEVKELTTADVSANLSKAKAAILAAVVLVYIQGGLPPSSGIDKRPIPKFVQGLVKQWAKSLVDIGAALSSTDTKKFPEAVFLQLPLKDLPAAVASRCRLNIAGNRAVRYAKFAAPFERAVKKTVLATMNPVQLADTLSYNARVQHAIDIADFLISVDGKEEALMKMHPLSPNRPTVKNLTAKLTRAILESLSLTGRLSMIAKIDDQSIAAFKADDDLYGNMEGDVREWGVLTDSEKDFSDFTIAVLKGYYGM